MSLDAYQLHVIRPRDAQLIVGGSLAAVDGQPAAHRRSHSGSRARARRAVDAGRQTRAAGMRWPKARWLSDPPEQAESLRALADALDRRAVRDACEGAPAGPRRAVDAFIAFMAWGFGEVGYAPTGHARSSPEPQTRRRGS